MVDESIVLSKSAKKLRKGQDDVPGTLTVTDSRLLWRPDDTDACSECVILLSSIKKQQQVAGKPFLRILSDGPPLGLAFSSENDKNDVLEYLKQRQGVERTVGGPKAAERDALFAKNKDLQLLYNQFVPTGILTESEFWSMHLKEKGGSSGRHVGKRIGLSSVMHEVEKLHDGKTEKVNIHLTPQDIQRIFQEKPEVNRAFVTYVPHSMTEEAFWQKYFKLEYKQAARRKNIATSGKIFSSSQDQAEDKDDIFAPFRQHILEEETRLAQSKLNNVDPTLNLFAEYGDRWGGGARSLGAGSSRTEEAPGTTAIGGAGREDGSRAAHTLANDLNRHSLHVLDGPMGDVVNDNESSVSMAVHVEAARKKHLNAAVPSSGDEIWRVRASSDLEDLRGVKARDNLPLNISDKSVFRRMNESAAVAHDLEQTDLLEQGPQKQDLVIQSDKLFEAPYYVNSAVRVLEEFSMADNESVVREFGGSGISAAIIGPEESMGSVMVEFFRLEALKTNELLRHFWSECWKTSENSKEKVRRFRNHLSQQREALVAHLKSQPGSQVLQIYIAKIVKPLVEAIDAALTHSE